MNTKLIFLLMLALGCGTLAAVAASQMMKSQQVAVPEQRWTEILVAGENLDLGSKVTKERFKLEKWPAERIPLGAVVDIKSVEGKFTNQPLYSGEPLLERKIMDNIDFVATKIPAGYRVFDMSLGESSTYIHPGDRVDIFGYFQKSSAITQTRSMRILQNVQVLMVDGVAVRSPENEAHKTAKTCQLLIKDSQYEALTTASNLGKLRLAMCGLSVNEITEGKSDNGEEFLEWVESSVGGKSSQASAPIFPDPMYIRNTPAPVEVPRDEHSIVVYSGGIAHEYRWSEDEIPMEVGGGSKPKAPATDSTSEPVNLAPPGKFTGTGTSWDPTTHEWRESDLKSGGGKADSNSNTTNAQLP